MKIDFVTLFPEQVLPGLRHSMLARAETTGLVQFGAVNPRDFAHDKHKTVDDRPFGGGPGMVMKPEPLDEALESIRAKGARVVFPDPCGYRFEDKHARAWASDEHIVFVCGHYEGIDHRLVEKWATDRVSLGDFVLTGGELAAMVMADAVVRQIPGVLGDQTSLEEDSHASGLLSYPQYTGPRTWEGRDIPEVLLSGDHAKIAAWRRKQALLVTRELRPDLFMAAELTSKDLDLLK